MTTTETKKHTRTTSPDSHTNMYGDATTWNPFKGCEFGCSYCIPSFQLRAKRQKHNCGKCYEYQPHFHPERLGKIPSSSIVFVCGNGDLAFATTEQRQAIISGITTWTQEHPRAERTFYLQSKRPRCFRGHLQDLGENTVLVTTLETNRDQGYEVVSTTAPPPSERYRQFLDLDYPRKIVTIEPVMDFDVDAFASWIVGIAPELVYLGFNSRSKPKLPEPSPSKLVELTTIISGAGIPITGKTLRGLVLPGVR